MIQNFKILTGYDIIEILGRLSSANLFTEKFISTSQLLQVEEYNRLQKPAMQSQLTVQEIPYKHDVAVLSNNESNKVLAQFGNRLRDALVLHPTSNLPTGQEVLQNSGRALLALQIASHEVEKRAKVQTAAWLGIAVAGIVGLFIINPFAGIAAATAAEAAGLSTFSLAEILMLGTSILMGLGGAFKTVVDTQAALSDYRNASIIVNSRSTVSTKSIL